jgi:transglutaminase-like putative cysteine protease
MKRHDEDDIETFLAPTEYIESEAPEITALASSLQRGSPAETAVALFNWVRDRIAYDPSTAVDGPDAYRATALLERGTGYCVQKAVLLAALGRAVKIPTRLGFSDVRNHKIPDHLLRLMGTDLFVFHGYVEFYLDGKWVKATPAFDPETTEKAGALPVELDGENDAMLHPVDPEGHPHIEYVRDRGHYADLPFDEIREALLETYPKIPIGSPLERG